MNKAKKKLFILLFIFSLTFNSLSLYATNENIDGLELDECDISAEVNSSYSEYLSKYIELPKTTEDIKCDLNKSVLGEDNLKIQIIVNDAGLYSFGMKYKCLDFSMADIRIGLKIDGEFPYSNSQKLQFPRFWCDEDGQNRIDSSGNEFAAQQVPYKEYCYFEAIDEAVENGDKFYIYLSSGIHEIELIPIDGKISIEYLNFSALDSIVQYDDYLSNFSESKKYNGSSIVIEGEDAKIKSSYFLVGKSDTSSTVVSPHSYKNSLVNYIGGGNWKTVGETIVWETPEVEEGYYNIGFSFRQNSVIGGKSYRTLKIDGKIPFSEAEMIGFTYDDNWQQSLYCDNKNKPYYIYLSSGKHEISLTVTSGETTELRRILTQAVAEMGTLYVDMTKITGETVDVYRDYDLFAQIGDMQERLEKIRSLLNTAGKQMVEITGEKSGSNYSVVNNMIEVIDQMLDNRFEAHRYKNYYYTNYCSVSSVLQDLRLMPLDIDKMVLSSPTNANVFEKIGFFEKIEFSVKRFIYSFVNDYDSISSDGGDGNKAVTIWVSWGRDQAQVLSALVDRSFTPKTGINVNIKLVNASVIQAVLSGNGPDCLLQHARSEPVNLAMRGVLYDLTEFDDYEQVLERFQNGSSTPYWYNGGLYALPDTQTFYVMFYRKDILDQYGIEIPETWEDFKLAAKLLSRNNMSVYMHSSEVTNVAQANAGVGSNNIYPTLLLQKGISLYEPGGKRTNLTSSIAIESFEQWTDYYTKLKLPKQLDFYNRFRIGTTPLGITVYSMYNTLKVAAPEIDGLWGFTSVPGTIQEDGSISHAISGGGTGCSILKLSKDPDSAWEFLKWWTDADTQLNYSNDIESILGPTGRVSLANVEAVKGLAWDDGALDELLNAWGNIEEIPEYPGSYYVSRSIYQAYWNVINQNKNTKDMLTKFGKEADEEIIRKWEQYTDR